MSVGRPLKPYLIAKAEGNPGKRRLNPGPAFEPGAPKCPSWLKGEGRKLWKKLAPELEEQGLLAKVNGTALEGLCLNYARAVAAEKILIEKGPTFEVLKEAGVDSEGKPKFVCTYVCQRPEVAIAMKSWQVVKGFCQEFGLTPSSNGKIVVPKLKKPNLRDSLSQSDVQSRTC